MPFFGTSKQAKPPVGKCSRMDGCPAFGGKISQFPAVRSFFRNRKSRHYATNYSRKLRAAVGSLPCILQNHYLVVSFTLAEINCLERPEFLQAVGPVFEHSPWIAELAFEKHPFASVASLHREMCAVVQSAPAGRQLDLIRAHPDLVGRVVLTTESQGEQTAAGLMDLSPEEVVAFDRYNQAYKRKFGFPFVICARLNKKEAILGAFPVRLENEKEQEIRAALEEIYKIADIRLHDLISS